jgi:ABC-type polysaccharide/polyol phosphate transport system ATPase subunit
LEIVNLSKKYVWHRAPRERDDDDPELSEEDTVPDLASAPGGERWALRGVNAIIKPGEKVGIIGANGAGKSTLLNILAGTTLPSAGYVRGRGMRVLLNSLHSPFRGHMTGRQNLHVLAALLGVETDRLETRIPEIIAFSDMEHLIDRRVLHYSTQQYRRLAFATALMLDPEIILSDETLGIGDARYQQRTEQLIAQKVEKDGVIFILASNDISTVHQRCTRVIWLEDGRVAADGPAEQVIEAFMDADRSIQDEETSGAVETASTSPAVMVAQNLLPFRVPLPEWSRRAKEAIKRRKTAKREQIDRWNRSGRPWMSVELASASLPGLAELVSVQFDIADHIKSDKSSLQVALRLEKPGTEVSMLVDGLLNQTYVFSSEPPEQLVAPASGLYFFTVIIDNVLLQPRTLDRPYAKSKIRVKAYVREPGSQQWGMLSGSVRINFQGEEWNPRIPYPVDRAPVLKPTLEWDVEMSPDEPTSASGAPIRKLKSSKQSALVNSGSRGDS